LNTPLIRKIRLRAVLVLALIVTFAAVILPASGASRRGVVDIQLLNVSDWHAQLDPLNGVGGAAALATYFNADRALNPNTLTLTAGDAYGAAPPLSGFFNEEPAIKAMRLMGVDVDTFGNHNFDRGMAHLQRMIDLAAATDQPGKPFAYLSANLQNLEENLTGVDTMKIFNVGKVKVAVIGITNPEAPSLVFPGNFGTIQVTDPVAAASGRASVARRAGAQVVVAITHMGVEGKDATGAYVGPLVDFAKSVSGFDVILGDHTDVQYSDTINGALVLENKSKGVTYARTKLSVDLDTNRIVSKTAEFVSPVANAVTPDQAVVDMLAPYRVELAKAYDTKVGVATDVFKRGGTPSVERSGETPIGNLIADSLRWRYGTQRALTNGGGIRAALPSSYKPLDTTLQRTTAPFDLVIGDIFTVLPFGNSVLTRTVTGAQLWAALENGVSQIKADGTGADGRFPQISGFRFTFNYLNAPGARVTSVTLNDGTAIPNDANVAYTFATNDFVNTGGDFYTMFRDGQGTTREVMADVLLEYVKSLGTITPVSDGRITKVTQ
jgi:5'-nucleotidase